MLSQNVNNYIDKHFFARNIYSKTGNRFWRFSIRIY